MHESQSLEEAEETLSSICILQMQIVHPLLSVFPNCAGLHFRTTPISKSGVRVVYLLILLSNKHMSYVVVLY